MPKLLRERYKTAEGAYKRARFENGVALSEFRQGYKSRYYKYRTVQDDTGAFRVQRETAPSVATQRTPDHD
jgi:hypothetical protein